MLSHFFRKKEPLPSVFGLRAGSMCARVLELAMKSGHPAFFVEVFSSSGGGEEVPLAHLWGEDLQQLIMLLQETMNFVNANAAMPRQLQTTWLRDEIYYVDERLRELRRKDDPSDRIPLAL
jgi:hypothetical protein